MALRPFSTVPYLPILGVRLAEMRAIEELPDDAKDRLLPLFLLRPWMSAHRLESATSRISDAYGDRPIIVDLDDDNSDSFTTRRPVHDELDALRNAANGYRNWCDFIENNENYIPSVQYGELTEVADQIQRLSALGRGMVIRLRSETFGLINQIASLFADTPSQEEICFVIDFERETLEFLTKQAVIITYIEAIRSNIPNCFVAISASSFPDSFVNIGQQDIFERRLFNALVEHGIGNLIYSDRGSARAERHPGGGGTPAPRIDIAGDTNWRFFREEIDEDIEDKEDAYARAANAAMTNPGWDSQLRIWGTQQIERTGLNIPDSINSPGKSTAVRINLHLYRQAFYGSPTEELYDTDDDWTD